MKLSLLDLIDFLVLTLGKAFFRSGFFFMNKSGRPFTLYGGKWPALVIHHIYLFEWYSLSWKHPFSPIRRHNSDSNQMKFTLPLAVKKLFHCFSRSARHID